MNSVYARLALETIAAAPIPGLAVCATLVATIVDSAKRAKHNKKLCKMLADGAERAHERIIRVQQSRLNSRAIDLYKESLDDTSQLLEKLQQPGLLYSLWRVLNSDEIESQFRDIGSKMDLAVAEITLDYVADIYGAVTDQSRHTIQLAAITGGATPSDNLLRDIMINPDVIYDPVGEDPVFRGDHKKVRKRLYQGGTVAEIRIGTYYSYSQEAKDFFRKQVIIMNLLRDNDHILKFFGIEERAQCFYVITQWAELGNLEDYLKSNDSSAFSWHEKYRIAHQVAHALFYCHEREVLHVDVRSPNILLDETMTAKLSNFEYSRKEDGVSVPARDQAIRIRWTAPEKLSNPQQRYTRKCDVYSFGILLWELASHKWPYYEIKTYNDLLTYVQGGGRPTRVEETPQEYQAVMEKCWDPTPSYRPRMQDACRMLYNLYDNFRKRQSIARRGFSTSIQTERHLQEAERNDDNVDRSEELEEYEIIPEELPALEVALNFHEVNEYAKAYPIFRGHALQGSAVAHYYLGMYLMTNHPGLPNIQPVQCVNHFRAAAEKGHHEAQYEFGKILISIGQEEAGIQYLRSAAIAGNMNAQNYLAAKAGG